LLAALIGIRCRQTLPRIDLAESPAALLQVPLKSGNQPRAASELDAATLATPVSLVGSIGRLIAFTRLFATLVPMRTQVVAMLLILAASLTEGIGIALLVPLLGLLGEHATASGPAWDAGIGVLNAIGLPRSLTVILGIFLAAIVTRAILMRCRDVTLSDLQYRFTDALRRRVYQAIEAAEWPFIAKEKLSNLAVALHSDVDNVGRGTFWFLRLPSTAVLGAVQLAIVLSIAPLLTLAVMACGGVIAVLARWLGGDSYAAGTQLMAGRRAIFEEISDFLASLKLAKSHHAGERHRLAFAAALARHTDRALGFTRRIADTQMLVQICSALVLGAFVYVGAELSHLSTPHLLIMIVVFARLMPLLMQLQQSVNGVWQMLPVFDDLSRLIARCEAARERVASGGNERLPLRHNIRLSGVCFRHDKEQGPDILARLNLDIPAGSVVAIVGASGAGKSTLADLLMGLLVPDTGGIAVDGEPLAGDRLAAWRRSVAYVPQENFLFNQSIRANLLWGYPEASEAQIADVLALAGAAATVAAMPKGLDTIVGERGSRFSGGERQRLIIARALLRNPTLLILDEATSALDHESERAVWTVIERLRGRTTVLVIAHRLSTVRTADRIVVLDGGRVVQDGAWDTLMQDDKGRFALLVRAGAVLEGSI
jgi:ATP-binding cassette subfamily C protein